MANSYFQFKQFQVHQDQCAMKVCTDSCILGAYANVDTSTRILDIGTGTGLLALMLAQRTTSVIDAVEIDEVAAAQANQNVANSPWSEQITVMNDNIMEVGRTSPSSYDLIICNPPFFSNHLKRKQTTQNVAMHGDSLQLPALAEVVSKLLMPQGRFIALLPPYESGLLKQYCLENGICLYEELLVFDYIGGKQIRTISSFSFEQVVSPDVEELYIKTSVTGTYTEAFIQLLQPYYLHM